MRCPLILCLLFSGSLAIAKPPPDADVESARQHNREGQKFYNLGEFKKAIDHFKKAYEIVQRPELLFNIAQAHRISRNFERALFFYKAFLRHRPNASSRPEVEKRIAAMETALRKQREASAAPPPGTVDAFGAKTPTSRPSATTQPARAPMTHVARRVDWVKTTPPPSPAPPPRPLYKRWWFWTGVGVLIAAGATAAALAASSGAAGPDTTFPTRPLF